MKIAQIAPLAESVPPKKYGGTERVVSWLTEELVRLGHSVTLFASGDSVTSAELNPVTRMALRLDPEVTDYQPYHYLLVDHAFRRSNDFDILHFHVDLMHFPLFRSMADRVVTTMHGRLDLPDIHPVYRAFPHMPLVSISLAQRGPMPPVNWVGNVPHGMPKDLLAPGRGDGGYLAFIGRITPEKGPEDAIAIAKKAGIPLKIAAKVDPVDVEYYETRVKHLLDDPMIEYIGEIDDGPKSEFLGRAAALLFPIAWPEPFGLSMIEAFACGTPVVAYDAGSVPEVIKDGVTGFIVRDVEESVRALKFVGELDRARIRAEFDERFTVERMAAEYVALYKSLKTRSAAARAA